MRAILLAAGLGSRLGPLTKQIPKAIVKVASQPLITQVINFSRLIGVDEVVVVGGYNSHRLWETIGSAVVTQIENSEFRKGNFYSLNAAKKYIEDDFVLLNIDHLYPTHLARMISKTSEGIWAVSDFDRPLFQDDMKIRIKGELLKDAQLTAISKGLDEYDGGYCGITIVRGKQACEKYNTAFNHVLQHGREQAVVEDIHAELIRLSVFPGILDISGIRWLEIDTQEDLANAERILKMKPYFLA